MLKKYVSPSSGLTMVELLAALAIFSMVIFVTAGAIGTTFTFSQKTQSHAQIRQEANLIMTHLRKQHQEKKENYFLCHEDFQKGQEMFADGLIINDASVSPGECQEVDPTLDIPVELVFRDHKKNSFHVETVLVSKPLREAIPPVIIEKPAPAQRFYDYLKNNHVFLYGGSIGVTGGTSVDGIGAGTMIINNHDTSLTFGGNNTISLDKIFIDRQGKEVVFSNSTKLGTKNITKLVSIKGDVRLNNGGARIDGEEIYIEGNVYFGRQASAVIEGKKVVITGDVSFGNWSARVIADEIYIGGNVSSLHPGHFTGTAKPLGDEPIPEHPRPNIPPLREDSWYAINGYTGPTTPLRDGVKIFADSFVSNKWYPNMKNVVIVSKGDITIEKLGSSELTGVLIAPNGKVTFEGGSFKGVVISRDGFDAVNGGSTVTYRGIDQFFAGPEDFPFAED